MDTDFTRERKPSQAAVCRKLPSHVGGMGSECGRGSRPQQTGVTERICPPPASAPRVSPRIEQKQSDAAPQGREWFCSLANVLKSCNTPSSPRASSQPPLGLASTNGGPGVRVSAYPTGLLLSQKPQGEAPAPHTHSPSKSPSSPSKPSLESSPCSGLKPQPQSPRCCRPIPTAALPPPARPVCVGKSDRVQPLQTLQ